MKRFLASDTENPLHGARLFLIAASCVVIIWGINQAQAVVVLFLISGFLAVIGTVPVLWMERKGIPTVVAVLVVITAMVALILGIGLAVGASLNGFSDAMPFYQTRIRDTLMDVRALLASKGISTKNDVFLGYANPAAILNLTASLFSALSGVLSNTMLILFTVMFILLEASSFPVKLRSVLEDPHASFPQFAAFVTDIKRYMVIKTSINLIAGTLTSVWLAVLGVDFPVLWGVLAFLLHFVPNVGSIVAAVPALLLALVQFGAGSAALVGAGYLTIGLILGNIIEPRIMGHRLGLSTLVVFVSLIFWGSMLGILGALLCVPLTMTVKLACEMSTETQWIAVLLGPETPCECIPEVLHEET